MGNDVSLINKGCRKLDITTIPVICLQIPLNAQYKQNPPLKAESENSSVRRDGVIFSITEGKGWTFTHCSKLDKNTRPDIGFDIILPFKHGFFYCNRSGKAANFVGSKSAIQVVDNEGNLKIARGFDHDLFRPTSHPASDYLSDLDFYGLLRVFDSNLNHLWSMNLAERSEVLNRGNELNLRSRETFRWIKDVAVAPDGNHILLAAIDQIWLINSSGNASWGLECPVKKGLISEIKTTDGMAEPILKALAVFELSPPIHADEIRNQYRRLALQWHPDIAADRPNATERMQEINDAYRVLTGADPEELLNEIRQTVVRYREDARYSKEAFTSEINGVKFGVSIEIGSYIPAAYAIDWLAHVAFSDERNRIYAATSSGRIYEIDPNGQAVRVYEIRSFPLSMQAVGDNLYVVTEDHLIVLAKGSLITAIPITRMSKVIVALDGIFIWSDKAVSWLSSAGQLLGRIAARDPIRRVRSCTAGWMLETRQHSGMLVGPPAWKGLRA